MFAKARHRAVEACFNRLVEDASLPRPDRVEYDAEAVTFYWDGPRTAVIVDLDRELPIEQIRSTEPSVAEPAD
ncbi:MAG TPA: hypothetical protein VGP30_04355 [Candidatus Limnocylindrales bacterium]|nr:hypothetical protein [Candidatus Limnocylindrales bacterium]